MSTSSARRSSAEHEERYGYRDADQELELVTIRITATLGETELELGSPGEESEPERDRRTAMLDGSELELDVWRGAPPSGSEIDGPAVVELAESTVLVPPGWRGHVHETGTIVLERAE